MLHQKPNIPFAGRSYDSSPIAAFRLKRDADASIAWCIGKITEWCFLCHCQEENNDCEIWQSCLDRTPFLPFENGTAASLAVRTLYEETRPDPLPGPGGALYVQEMHNTC